MASVKWMCSYPPSNHQPETLSPYRSDHSYDGRPLVGEGEINRLVLRPFPQAERFLRPGVLVGDLARQVEHQADAVRLQGAIEVQRKVARRAPLSSSVAGEAIISGVGRDEVAGVLSERNDEVLRADRLKLLCKRLHVKVLDARQLLRITGQEVHEDAVPGGVQPVRAPIWGVGGGCQSHAREERQGECHHKQ